MVHSRRAFLHSLAGSAAFAAGAASTRTARAAAEGSRKRLLILGGTGFLGPHIVETAISRGHDVTLFNRGRTNPHLFPDVRKLRGDRDPEVDGGLSALEGGTWDAVIDTSGYFPRHVRASARLLAGTVDQYVFISSISVYADVSRPGLDETAPLGTIDDPTMEQVTGETYGPLKALCEQAADEAMKGRATNIRPGLIVGPRDSTDRFSYWPVRVAREGEVLAPGDPDDPVQYIDVRDLADWTVRTVEDGTVGCFNANGPQAPTNIAELLYGCKAVSGGDTTFTWVNADFLETHDIQPWMHMTVWMPPRGDYEGFHRVDCRKAIAAGLTFRPLADTVQSTLDWFRSLPDERQAAMRAGLAAEREAEVLAAWHANESS